MTEIKILIKNSSDIDFNNSTQVKSLLEEPCEVYINGEKQTNIKHFSIDLPLENWGRGKQYNLDDLEWSYTLTKKIPTSSN